MLAAVTCALWEGPSAQSTMPHSPAGRRPDADGCVPMNFYSTPDHSAEVMYLAAGAVGGVSGHLRHRSLSGAEWCGLH
jgi:hypothetical protein